jgi:Polyketide cyclase / dehydrase and lipid transport
LPIIPTAHYSFTTIWKLEAPIALVWSKIHAIEQWPRWWKGVKQVKLVHHGLENGLEAEYEITFKSVLPYTLVLRSKVVRLVFLKLMEGKATGELEGTGLWTLSENDNVTTVLYDWKVVTTRWWMNAIAPIARPIFIWNHNQLMKQGGVGLAMLLNCKLIQ